MSVAALIAVAGAMVLVRIGWAGAAAVAAAGWSMAAFALVVLARADGAWGIAIGVVTAIAAALLLVLLAGWRSPVKRYRPPREPPSITIPRRRHDIVRRVAVFALVVPGAFAAAQWLAFGAQAIARRSGAADADAIAMTLYLQPIMWSVIMAIQMTRAGPARMVAPLAVATVIGAILWGAS